MKKYLALFILIFISSCGSKPEIIEEPLVEEPIQEPMVVEEKPVEDTNSKFGYTLVPGMDLKETERGIIIVLENPVNFKLRESKIEKQYDASFEVVKAFIDANSNIITRIIVEGHTDNTGRAYPTNVVLSKKRSLSGIEELSDMGLSRTLMVVRALGEAMPEYSGKNDYKNRRLKFAIMKDDADLKKYNSVVSKLNLKKNR